MPRQGMQVGSPGIEWTARGDARLGEVIEHEPLLGHHACELHRGGQLWREEQQVVGETEAVQLAEARDEGRELLGRARPAQASQDIFTAEAFDVDVANQRARCPAGKTSTSCLRVYDHQRDRWGYRFQWGEQCDRCPLQSQCTTKQGGRRVLNVGEHHDLVQARRRAMETEDFKAKMRQRAGIEGTLSELKRNGLGRTRYRGLRKTALGNFLIGAACNVRRWLRRLAWEMARTSAAS